MLTKELYYKYKKLHKELWLWLSENPTGWKEDWPKHEEYDIFNECFPCEIHTQHVISKFSRQERCFCPIINWNNGKSKISVCTHPGSLYSKWIDACYNLKKRSQYAKKIANLKWKTWENFNKRK